jgi:N-acetylmuramoyl-L-alanine amidase
MSVVVSNHRVTGVPFIAAADHGGHFAPAPRFIVLHYTAGRTMDGAVQQLLRKDDAYVSAHIVVGRDGKMTQLVPFDTIAYHAGESAWAGVRRLNTCSIGVEMVNPGFCDLTDTAVNGWETISACHKNGGTRKLWYTYPQAQIQATADLCKALKSMYPIENIVGHDDVAPNRKSDPGPAFNWTAFRALL